MLVLTRRVGQRIVILVKGQVITVELLENLPNRAKFGFKAPDDVRILREELLNDQKLKGNE